MSFQFLNQLPSPDEIKAEYPLPPALADLKKERDEAINQENKIISTQKKVY